MALCVGIVWLTYRAVEVKDHLSAASSIAPQIKVEIAAGKSAEARHLLDQVQDHTHAARVAASDPLWKITSLMPLIGPNFHAISEVAQAADSVATGAADPLLAAFDSLASVAASPVNEILDVTHLREETSGIAAASLTTETATARLEALDKSNLLPEISGQLNEVIHTLHDINGPLKLAAEASGLLPAMLGSNEPRNYLLLVQNNAEIRATGGLPGALAVVQIDKGKLQLTGQVSAKELGKFVPPVDVDAEQKRIFSTRLGAYISDVNLTPDFPTVAQAAKAMWETRYGSLIDGVIAIDPIVLSHILAVIGPLPLPNVDAATSSNLPSSLTAENVVKTLLSDVYVTLAYGEQDLFFASVAHQVFATIAAGKAPTLPLIKALAKSVEENRLHIWSQRDAEQRLMVSTRLGGSVSIGPDADNGSFGAFFNDGTGAKMDYHVDRTVQLLKKCPRDGYEEVIVRISSTNTAPLDAAISLPSYVTGDGIFGVPPGSVQTNILAYGPEQAHIDMAKLDGGPTNFASYLHSARPVGVVSIRLAPGESRTLEFTFRRSNLNPAPHLVVTPTVQPIQDVILPMRAEACG